MNALIGMDASVKLILLSLDDDTRSPQKTDLRRFFPKGKINIYKANGHHRESFWELESIFDIVKNGSENHSYYNRRSIITHVIKLEEHCEIDDFFTLTYTESIVGIVKVTEQCLEKAKALVIAVAKANQEISKVTCCKDRMLEAKDLFVRMCIDDPKVTNPNETYMANLFDNYGAQAYDQMTRFVKKWLDKRLCN